MSDKILHSPYHKIPTVKWNHWGKKDSEAKKLTLEEIKEWATSSPQSSPR